MKVPWPPTFRRWTRKRTRTLALTVTGAMLATLGTCSPTVPVLTRVEALKLLRVATVNSPTTYYVGPAGPTGFEYDLTRSFAQDLGVEVEMVLADSPAEMLELVRAGRAHLAAGLSVTPSREKHVRFTPPLRSVVPQLVYRAGGPKPRTLYDLEGELMVPADSAAAELLKHLAGVNPALHWQETPDYGTEELLYRVANQQLDYTIAPSDLVAINQRYYPKLRVAFALSDPQNIAWAFAPGDDSLYQAALNFLDRLDRKELIAVRDRHFGHVSKVGAFGALALATHTQTRLPRYRKAFEDAATRHGLDWRLLAALGYQESLWDPAAVSPTGVRGLMQITTDTAEFLNLENRLDPVQSIYAAARYLQQLHARLPPEIGEPDRTWMALAAYNVGTGHVVDARELTRQQGGDPNRWVDVRVHLPLLTQAKWHRKTRYGYARGHEAVTYVSNIRAYYDMLAWITGSTQTLQADSEAAPEAKKPDKQEEPLNIISPVL